MPATAVAVQPNGGELRVGNPGNIGGSGRPKEVLRARLRALVEARKGHEYVASVMDGTAVEKVAVTVGSGKEARVELVEVPAKTRDRLLAYELLVDRAWGKPDQAVQIEDERPRLTGDALVARLMELLPRVLHLLPVDRQEIARLFKQRQQIEVLVQGKTVASKAAR